MKAAVFAYSRRGMETAQTVLKSLPEGSEGKTFATARLAGGIFTPIDRDHVCYGESFRWADAMIFVGAAGIAVRSIAPYVKSKQTDPAVLVIDELGQYVIPVLSGHIGGANDLARTLADSLGATAVITTATDINEKWSVDAWAARQGFAIDSLKEARAVSAAILEGPVPLYSDLPIAGELPPGVVAGQEGPVGVLISWEEKRPFGETLLLVPPVLRLGLGCRRDTPAETIREAVSATLAENGLHPKAVAEVASIDLKAHERGLLELCRERNWPVSFYTKEQLQAVEGDFTPSDFVRSVTGVDNVCERAALLGAERLLVRKTARNGVTVAVAIKTMEVRFG